MTKNVSANGGAAYATSEAGFKAAVYEYINEYIDDSDAKQTQMERMLFCRVVAWMKPKDVSISDHDATGNIVGDAVTCNGKTTG